MKTSEEKRRKLAKLVRAAGRLDHLRDRQALDLLLKCGRTIVPPSREVADLADALLELIGVEYVNE